MATQTIQKNDKHTQVCAMYEIKWDDDRTKNFLDDYQKNFPITQHLSDWLHDLTSCNIDEIGMAEREWYVYHKTPGHIFVFLHIISKDRSHRIQYPFTEPNNWAMRPFTIFAEWTETSIPTYLVAEKKKLEAGTLYFKTRVGSKPKPV